jgi:hypothetical protein
MNRALERRLRRLEASTGEALGRVVTIYSRTPEEAAGELARLKANADASERDLVMNLTGYDGPTRSDISGVDMLDSVRAVDGNTRGSPAPISAPYRAAGR